MSNVIFSAGNINFDYYEFQKSTVINKINNEIKYLESRPLCNMKPFSLYVDYLKTRIGLNVVNNPVFNYYNKCELKKMDMNQYSKDLDELVFKKQWSKLKLFHKIMKIREYIDCLEYNEHTKEKKIANNKQYLKSELESGLKNKNFNKNKSEIVYDIEAMKILSISCLEYDKKKGIYRIDWDN